jgi:hypothetical protein
MTQVYPMLVRSYTPDPPSSPLRLNGPTTGALRMVTLTAVTTPPSPCGTYDSVNHRASVKVSKAVFNSVTSHLPNIKVVLTCDGSSVLTFTFNVTATAVASPP